MALTIRMSRGGAKKRPYYRIVVADSRYPRDGRFIERIGTFDPMLAKDHPERVTFKMERVQHWLGMGARPSDRVARFLAALDVIAKPAIPEQTKQHLPRAKAQERMREAEEAKKAAEEAAAAAAAAEAEAAAAPAEEEAPAEEAPAEEAPAEEAAAEEEPKAE